MLASKLATVLLIECHHAAGFLAGPLAHVALTTADQTDRYCALRLRAPVSDLTVPNWLINPVLLTMLPGISWSLHFSTCLEGRSGSRQMRRRTSP